MKDFCQFCMTCTLNSSKNVKKDFKEISFGASTNEIASNPRVLKFVEDLL